jgi:hypothetical protein
MNLNFPSITGGGGEIVFPQAAVKIGFDFV